MTFGNEFQQDRVLGKRKTQSKNCETMRHRRRTHWSMPWRMQTMTEIKQAVFRTMTRLQEVVIITEFDTIARLETPTIDACSDEHQYRTENPLAHFLSR